MFRTDCLSVLQVFLSGHSAASSGRCKLARIWHGIFAALDDQDTAMVDLAWMPSHTIATDVGVKTLSNGVLLSSADRFGNGEANRLAKLAAAVDRVPLHIWKSIADALDLAKQLCRWVGQATAMAGEFAAADGSVWHDSKPAERRPRPPRGEGRRPRPAAAAAQPAVPPLVRWASALQATAVTEASLRHGTHRLITTGRVT